MKIKTAIISYGYLKRSYEEPSYICYETIIMNEYTDKKFYEWISDREKEQFHITFYKLIEREIEKWQI